ncbi:MAG: hypothetical protein GXP53_10145 [Deltaproteobacteria bacterium]|nr:hypothetical protein [Deltaproteobacteria bacterium]
MKQYVIDEIRPTDHERLKDRLDEYFGAPDLGDIYWLPMEPRLYTATQAAHDQCHPLCISLYLCPDSLVCEFLVRTKNRIRCDCMAYATPAQREWIIETVDAMLEGLEIMF